MTYCRVPTTLRNFVPFCFPYTVYTAQTVQNKKPTHLFWQIELKSYYSLKQYFLLNDKYLFKNIFLMTVVSGMRKEGLMSRAKRERERSEGKWPLWHHSHAHYYYYQLTKSSLTSRFRAQFLWEIVVGYSRVCLKNHLHCTTTWQLTSLLLFWVMSRGALKVSFCQKLQRRERGKRKL